MGSFRERRTGKRRPKMRIKWIGSMEEDGRVWTSIHKGRLMA